MGISLESIRAKTNKNVGVVVNRSAEESTDKKQRTVKNAVVVQHAYVSSSEFLFIVLHQQKPRSSAPLQKSRKEE